MEDKNIYKIVLNYINVGSLDKDIEKDRIYMNNGEQYHPQNESIESLAKKRLEHYYEYYHSCEEKKSLWSTIEIIVYWDRKNDVAYEITTGSLIPLLMVNVQCDKLLSNGIKISGDLLDLPSCDSYTKASELGYFGEISYYYIETKVLPKREPHSSDSHLEELREYFKEHSDHDAFQQKLNSIFEQSKKYMKYCVNSVISNIKENSSEIEECSKVFELKRKVC